MAFWEIFGFRTSEIEPVKQGQAIRGEVVKDQIMMTLSGQPRDLMKGLKQKSQMVTEGHTEITLNSDSQSGEDCHHCL